MFTGIIEELGEIVSRTDTSHGTEFRLAAVGVLKDARIGDSIAVNGCCLTATRIGDGWWECDAVPETLARTNLADVQPGDVVNLERPLRLGDRLDGHLVQGHVDGVGEVAEPAPDLRIIIPSELRRYVVEKGSITIDGISLTVVKPTADGCTVAVIPHTAEVTTLGRRKPGERVNLEVDVMAKYAERLIAAHLPGANHAPSSH
jgi:riboflavin synthase